MNTSYREKIEITALNDLTLLSIHVL